MPCHEPIACRGGSIGPLWRKEFRDVLLGRAFWAALLIAVPLTGYGYTQAVWLYAEASRAAERSPELGRGLSPLDGILAPTFGGLYLVSTLLYPFVVIRTLGVEKQTGTYQLLLQLPYSLGQLLAAKFAAAIAAWLVLMAPCLAATAIWASQGGHVAAAETMNLLLGHALFALVVAGVSLVAAAITESAASASIVAIGVMLGFWVLDFAAVGESGLLKELSQFSLTRVVKSFERGIFALNLAAGSLVAAIGLTTLAAVWLRPDWPRTRQAAASLVVIVLTALAIAGTSRIHFYRDAAEDRRNSFAPGEEALLRSIDGPLSIRVHLSATDPRSHDLEQNVLAKLRRATRRVRVTYADVASNTFIPAADDDYGKIVYSYRGHEATSRSTSEEEALAVIFQLAGLKRRPDNGRAPYPGYPLVAGSRPAEILFYYLLPVAVVCGWLLATGAWPIAWRWWRG